MISSSNARKTPYWAALILFACSTQPIIGADSPISELQSVAERSEYRATARYAEVLEFCKTLHEGSDLVTLNEFGVSHEQRSLPLLIVSKEQLPAKKPWEHAKLPAILCVGNIHAGEVCGKEALLMLVRDLVLEESPELLEHFVLLIAPIYNADGNEQMSKDNRPGQVGPEEGMGQRHNQMDLDLNRDYVKLEAPESRAMVRLLRNWEPAVVIDTHTTNGSYHRYTLTYDGPRHPATHPELADFVRQTLLPGISRKVSDSSGYDTFFYGNFESDHTQWKTYPALPRYGGHYVGLRNRISILSEAYSYASYKDRVLATQDFVSQCLHEVVAQREKIAKLLDEADKQASKATSKVALRHRIEPYEDKIVVKGYVEQQQDGKPLATDEPHDYEVEHWARSTTDLSVSLPAAYVFSADLKDCIENLQRHGISVEQLRENVELDIEVSRIGSVGHTQSKFEGRHLTELAVERETRRRPFPPGTLVVRTKQPLSRLIGVLLEPESEDGLAAWKFFDERCEEGGEYPVYRVLADQTMLTAPVRPLEEDCEFGRRVTFETLYGEEDERVDFSPPSTRVRWMPEGQQYLQTREGALHKVDAITGRSSRYPNPENLVTSLNSITSMEPSQRKVISNRTSFQWNAQMTDVLINHGDDLYHLPIDGSPALRLTRSHGEEQYAQYSPDGLFVAYVRDQNLYVCDVETQTEQTLTAENDPLVRNGEASWVYFEELYSRRWKAFWWSPDSRHVAFCRFDEQGIPTFHALDHIPQHGKLKSLAIPKPGDRNPAVSLGVAHVSGSPVQWVDLSNYTAGEFLVSHVDWHPDGDLLYFYIQDRAQTWLDFCTCKTGETNSERLFRETTEAWVDSPGKAWWVENEIVFLSERSGWKHLYAFDRDSKDWREITTGEWEIRQVQRVGEESDWIYFTACKRSPIATDWLRVRVDGSGLERLTDREGTHRISVATSGSLAIDSWSNFVSAGDIRLINADGQALRTVDSRPTYVLEEFELGDFQQFQIPTEDGFLLEAALTFPVDFDESKQYPVWVTTYGGPHAPTIRNADGPKMRMQMLANLGLIVFQIDPRSASGKGAQSTWAAYRQLGVSELEDIKHGIAWLTEKPYVDADRIGFSGHSYGGFMTAYVMTHSELFAAGISGAPVTDWNNYDSIYTERYMNTPQENPEGYEKTSVVKAADKLHGRLLLLHGMMDDNVHPQNSMQFIQALQRAKKDFQIMVYPQKKHGLSGGHYNRMTIDFIKRTFHLENDAPEDQ